DKLISVLSLLASPPRSLLITTSEHERPAGSLPGHSVPCPRVVDEDALEFLVAAGAPNAVVNLGTARLLNALASGNPTILSALVRTLKSKSWPEPTVLIREPAYSADLNVETVSKLVSRHTDAMTRDLLYRLSLVGWKFPMHMVDVIAAQPP